jgi:DNA-binding transcriptional ArsR family regulator
MEVDCGTIRANMQIDDEKMGTDYVALAAALAALGEPTRLRLLALLMTFNEPLCVCELSSGLGLPDYQTSRHLVALRRAGLVAYSRQGLWAYYRPTDSPHVRFLRNVLCADAEDVARMHSRLQQRVAGRCVVGPACAAAEKERGKVSPLAAMCGSKK